MTDFPFFFFKKAVDFFSYVFLCARASGDRADNSFLNFISSFAKQTNPMRGMNLIVYLCIN